MAAVKFIVVVDLAHHSARHLHRHHYRFSFVPAQENENENRYSSNYVYGSVELLKLVH